MQLKLTRDTKFHNPCIFCRYIRVNERWRKSNLLFERCRLADVLLVRNLPLWSVLVAFEVYLQMLLTVAACSAAFSKKLLLCCLFFEPLSLFGNLHSAKGSKLCQNWLEDWLWHYYIFRATTFLFGKTSSEDE